MKLFRNVLFAAGLMLSCASPALSSALIEHVPLPTEAIILPEHVYFPSDGTKVEETMIDFNVTVSIIPLLSNDRYALTLCYNANPYVDNKKHTGYGNLSDVTFKIVYTDTNRGMEKYIGMWDSFKIHQSDCIGIYVQSTTGADFHLENLEFAIFDKQGNKEASFPIPVFVPDN